MRLNIIIVQSGVSLIAIVTPYSLSTKLENGLAEHIPSLVEKSFKKWIYQISCAFCYTMTGDVFFLLLKNFLLQKLNSSNKTISIKRDHKVFLDFKTAFLVFNNFMISYNPSLKIFSSLYIKFQ